MWDYKGQIEKARQSLPENTRIKRSLNGCDVFNTQSGRRGEGGILNRNNMGFFFKCENLKGHRKIERDKGSFIRRGDEQKS